MEKEVVIDGSQGEGGGQVFRTSLTLAMCLGKNVRIENIRAGRQKPGLLRQHLACLKAAREICDAEVIGEALGAKTVLFKPGKIKAGHYHFVVGTAGSTTLIFQTIMMPLLMASGQSEIVFEGGTHNAMAPTYHFIEKSFLPLLKGLGCDVSLELEKYGFYPAGGGVWSASITPTQRMIRLNLHERGETLATRAVALLSKIPRHVGERELSQVRKKLRWPEECLEQHFVESIGPGNILSLQVEMRYANAVFDAFGERGVSAEKVAEKAIDAYSQFDRAKVPVCRHLADQLILPLALSAGGSFLTERPSLHLLTNIEVIRHIAGTEIDIEQVNEQAWSITINN